LVVHIGLIVTVVVSLVLEPIITVHVAVGFGFVGLVVGHIAQRSRTTRRLLRGLVATRLPISRVARMAWADAVLAFITAVMLGSGLWDWLTGHPTRIRWHAISGVLLAALLAVHTVRRRRRLSRSAVR
jgi:hypothetical protein